MMRDHEWNDILYLPREREKPDLLRFKANGDKWQTVHGWLLQAAGCPTSLFAGRLPLLGDFLLGFFRLRFGMQERLHNLLKLRVSSRIGAFAMTYRINPAFERFPEEGNLVGFILSSFGELELTVCECARAALRLGDYSILKVLYQLRATSSRIDTADGLMRPFYERMG